jgi:hypothetical protein
MLKRSRAVADDCAAPPSEWRKRQRLVGVVDYYYCHLMPPRRDGKIPKYGVEENCRQLKTDFARRGEAFIKFLEHVRSMKPWEVHADAVKGVKVQPDTPPFFCKERPPPCEVCHACNVVFEHGNFYTRGISHSGYIRDMLFMIIQCIDFIAGGKGLKMDESEGVDNGVLCRRCVQTFAARGPEYMQDLIDRLRCLHRISCKALT